MRVLELRNWRSWRTPVCLMSLAIVAIGCGGGSDDRATATVIGKVTSKGQPVTGGGLTFSPISADPKVPPGKSAAGAIQPDGTYKLSTYKQDDGAVVSKHKVTFSAAVIPIDEKTHSENSKPPVSPYANLIPSKPEVEVKAGENTIEIELIPDPKAPVSGS